LEVRARRRDCRPAGRVHQHHRRHDRRHRPAGHRLRAGGGGLPASDRQRAASAQHAIGYAQAAASYTLLTVGDGLVTQVPALIVSTAAGLLVSKAGLTGAADKALLKQLSGYPKALGMSGAVMLVMSLLPGIPIIPFMALGSGAAALAFIIDKRAKLTAAADAKKTEATTTANAADEPIATALKIDDLKVELGYAL